MSIIKSLYFNQDEILQAIIKLYCSGGFECDITYGNGAFYKNIQRPKLCFDITPLHDFVIKSDSTKLPLDDNTLNNVIFDPPFLTYIKNGRNHKDGNVALSARFGGYYSYDELTEHYQKTIDECFRVLKKGGILIFKCQDIIHNHKMHCTHHNVINWAAGMFRLKDLFILGATHRMPSPQKGQQRHARIWHSYFLILEKL